RCDSGASAPHPDQRNAVDHVGEGRRSDGDLPSGGEIGVALDRAQRGRRCGYRAGAYLENERDGLVHDYTRRGGVEDAFIVAPEGAEWAQDRSALWNAAEAAEKRKDAKVAREYELGLPAELDAGQRRDLVRAFAEDVCDRYGVAVDAAIHAPMITATIATTTPTS
ncbi:MobA/MobL family protein, partial [Sphingomonas carotinifaciens]|uniref:MobA/MobL family protein n=1 Tax=Sphingomonas carotinifaciens TaxID=1166323 RepID=UPI001B8649C5